MTNRRRRVNASRRARDARHRAREARRREIKAYRIAVMTECRRVYNELAHETDVTYDFVYKWVHGLRTSERVARTFTKLTGRPALPPGLLAA